MKTSYPTLTGTKGNAPHRRRAYAWSVVGWIWLLSSVMALSPLSDDRFSAVQEAAVNGPVIDIWYGDTQELGNNGGSFAIVLPWSRGTI